MATPVSMPKLGLSMKTGTVGKWLKNEGDQVKKGEAIVEVMTEKITNKIEAPEDGILLKIVSPKGAKLPIGGLMGVIGAAGEDISAVLSSAGAPAAGVAPAQGAAPAAGDVKISPAARKLAQENNIDFTRVTGTGPQGRITREDIQNAIDNGVGPADDRPAREVIPYEGMRRAIGENMINSWNTAAKVTHMVDVDMSAMKALRKSINEGLSDKERVSVTALLIKAIARAIEIKPAINAVLDGEEIKVLKDINVGMAIALDDGLIVPPIRNADTKKLDEINKEVKDLAKKARKNKLSPDEMVGSTFTITNLGAFNSVDHFTPIINQPESAILGIGRTIEKPVAVNGEVVIRPMMGLSLSFDHRVIDGAPAAEWLGVLINLIEHPHKIFI